MRFKRMTAAVAAALLAQGLASCGPVAGLETQARILTQPPCSDFFFPIFFAGRSPAVPGTANRTVLASSLRARGCAIEAVEVVGLPDPKQAVAPGLELSRQRAQRVAEALKRAGFPEPRFKLSPFGDAGEGLPAAKLARRRADVYVRFMR